MCYVRRLLLLSLFFSSTVHAGCVGSCGRQADTGCWCDPSCKKTGDCCLDFISACSEYQPRATSRAVDGNNAPTSTVSQCLNNCGGKATTGCWCEPSCAAHGDCCSDLLTACPQYANSLAYPGKTTCLGMCGNHTSFCWCDGGCIAKGDCCDDFNAICLQSAQAKLLSCAGYCGAAHPSGSCNCDSLCLTAADCCPDFSYVCTAANSGPSPAPTIPTFTKAQNELDSNKLMWSNAGLSMYSFHYKHSCDICPASYSGEKIITYSTSQGVVSIKDVDTGGMVPTDDFSDYKLIPDIYDLIQAAINEQVSVLTVGYDTTYGFPVMVNIRWNAKEQDHLFITGFQDLGKVLAGCLPNLRPCPDGSSLPRDPLYNCTFKLCANVSNSEGVSVNPNPVLDVCGSRVPSLGFCFSQDGIPSDSQAGQSCMDYYNNHVTKWNSSQIAGFVDCVQNDRLCDTTIEYCLLTSQLSAIQTQLDQAKSLWDAAQFQVYAFTYQCTGCAKTQQTPKIITVNLQQGITGILDSATGSSIPVSQWSGYPTVAGVFDYISQAIKERVKNISVTFDLSQNGLPTYFNLDWTSGNLSSSQGRPSSARLSAPTNLNLGVSDCSKEVRICPDGTLSSRNPKNQCAFDECSLGLGSTQEANDWCMIRNNRTGFCWMEDDNPAPLNDPIGGCIAYYTSEVNYWTPAERTAFHGCAYANCLCRTTIEACIDTRTGLQDDLTNNMAKWQARGLQYYSFTSQQTCGGCVYTGQIKLTVQDTLGVVNAMTLQQDAIAPSLWSNFRAVDGVFGLLQAALDAFASSIVVTYDSDFGFPASVSITWTPEKMNSANITTIQITSLTDLGAPPSRCPTDTRRCSDGSVLVRDVNINCDFPPCPLGRGAFTQGTSLCSQRLAAGGWCWMQSPESTPGQGVPADRCVSYFTAKSAQWGDSDLNAFTQCAASNKLCDQTIEACMYRLGVFSDEVKNKKQQWDVLHIQSYQYNYDQICPACTQADRATKLVIVKNNVVTNVYDIAQRLSISSVMWKNYKTIIQLYELIDAGLSSASDVSVDWDVDLPIPRQIVIDVKANSKGDEITITISQFTNLDSNSSLSSSPRSPSSRSASASPSASPSSPPSSTVPSASRPLSVSSFSRPLSSSPPPRLSSSSASASSSSSLLPLPLSSPPLLSSSSSSSSLPPPLSSSSSTNLKAPLPSSQAQPRSASSLLPYSSSSSSSLPYPSRPLSSQDLTPYGTSSISSSYDDISPSSLIPAYSAYLASLSSPSNSSSSVNSSSASANSSSATSSSSSSFSSISSSASSALRPLRGCPATTRLCPDGSTQARDPTLQCQFPTCPDCASDAFSCPDGSSVRRKPELQCQFPPCLWRPPAISFATPYPTNTVTAVPSRAPTLITSVPTLRTSAPSTSTPSVSKNTPSVPYTSRSAGTPTLISTLAPSATKPSPKASTVPTPSASRIQPSTASVQAASQAVNASTLDISSICSSRDAQVDWCWQAVGPETSCLDYYNNNQHLWTEAELLAFTICAQGYSLCKNPVEACMWKQLGVLDPSLSPQSQTEP